MACKQLARSGRLPSAGLLEKSPAGAASSSQAVRLWRALRALLVSALGAFEFAPSSSGQERGFHLGRNGLLLGAQIQQPFYLECGLSMMLRFGLRLPDGWLHVFL